MLVAGVFHSIRVEERMEEREEALPQEPSQTVGARLRAAREAAGLGREDIAARTKIAERHLVAIEEDRLTDLASRTYAVGFARTYARAVGLDEGEIANAVRAQLDVHEQANRSLHVETFEPGDPARIPPARIAWVTAIGGVLAVVILLLLFRPGFLSPQGSLPDLLRGVDEVPPPTATASVAPPAARPEQASGEVVFTATAPRVWVKFYDAAGNQLFQKEMGEGERFALPADAEGPLLWTARPDALEITVGGKRVARLADKPVTMKDVPVSAEALLARKGAPVPGEASPGVMPAPSTPPRPAAPSRAVSKRSNGLPPPQPAASADPRPAALPQAASKRSNDAAPSDPAPAASAAAPAAAAVPVSTDSVPPSTVSE